jgi:myosin heavy chain 6/7
MDSMQASLEAEARAKSEALRIKKKLESDINELEIALDHSNKANAEAHKSIKRYQLQFRDVEQAFEEEFRQRQEISEKAGLADRKANALASELEEARTLLDSADRGKKQADLELADARSAVNDMTTINSKANSEKRRYESSVHTAHAEIDDVIHQVIFFKSFIVHLKCSVDILSLKRGKQIEQEH